MHWGNSLRLGIIFTVAGLITHEHAVVDYFRKAQWQQQIHLSQDAVKALMRASICLLAAGVPLLVVGVRGRSADPAPAFAADSPAAERGAD